MTDTYTCAACGGTFNKGWADEEAAAEAGAVFGGHSPDDAIVCDDCYKAMTSAIPPVQTTWTGICDTCHQPITFVQQAEGDAFILQPHNCPAPKVTLVTDNPRKLGVITGLT